jgi:hypothetical protein
MNHIGGVMVSMLSPNPVYRGFEPWSDQIKDYKIVFVTAALRIEQRLVCSESG